LRWSDEEGKVFMPLYEHVFLARQDVSTQQVEGLVQSFRSLLEERGGTVGKTEYWGLKSLTYRIKKNRKAHFTLLNIDAPHEAVAELERQIGLSTDVIRFLTIRVDEHEQGPSPMMRRADRDEREGREGRGDRDRDGRGDRDGRRGGRRDRDRDYAPRESRHEPEGAERAEGGEDS
jgi:small subunit ribosomal protein S6